MLFFYFYQENIFEVFALKAGFFSANCIYSLQGFFMSDCGYKSLQCLAMQNPCLAIYFIYKLL